MSCSKSSGSIPSLLSQWPPFPPLESVQSLAHPEIATKVLLFLLRRRSFVDVVVVGSVVLDGGGVLGGDGRFRSRRHKGMGRRHHQRGDYQE